jgi:hypothetical protein
MIHLQRAQYGAIKLEHCGILFLATPHGGSPKADWNNYVLNMAHATAGVRSEIVDLLKTLGIKSGRDIADFFRLQPVPPFRCLAEGRETLIKGTFHHVSSFDISVSSKIALRL